MSLNMKYLCFAPVSCQGTASSPLHCLGKEQQGRYVATGLILHLVLFELQDSSGDGRGWQNTGCITWGSDPWESIGKKSREIEFPWYSIIIPSTKIISMEETPFQELSWLLSSIQKIPRFSSVRSYFIGVPANDSLPCNREAFIWKAEQLRNN